MRKTQFFQRQTLQNINTSSSPDMARCTFRVMEWLGFTKDGEQGCLGCSGFILVMFSFLFYMRSSLREEKVQAEAKAHEFIQKSQSLAPDLYFERMTAEWKLLCSAHSHWESRDAKEIGHALGTAEQISVEKTDGGKFGISINGGFLSEYEDLGITGRRNTIEVIAAAVWMSGSHIDKVSFIKSRFETHQGALSAEYIAELNPLVLTGGHWNSFSQASLKEYVEINMKVLSDTASGKHWIKVPKR